MGHCHHLISKYWNEDEGARDYIAKRNGILLNSDEFSCMACDKIETHSTARFPSALQTYHKSMITEKR